MTLQMTFTDIESKLRGNQEVNPEAEVSEPGSVEVNQKWILLKWGLGLNFHRPNLKTLQLRANLEVNPEAEVSEPGSAEVNQKWILLEWELGLKFHRPN